jgi:CheY-like chemotaxis protein
VLLAEDDLDDQEMLIEALKEQDPGIHLLVTNSGTKALDLLSQLPDDETPSVILLDYNLPEISGADVLARLREMKKYDKILKVIWSTSSSPVYRQKCLDLGAHCYLVKPSGVAGIRLIARELTELCAKAFKR